MEERDAIANIVDLFLDPRFNRRIAELRSLAAAPRRVVQRTYFPYWDLQVDLPDLTEQTTALIGSEQRDNRGIALYLLEFATRRGIYELQELIETSPVAASAFATFIHTIVISKNDPEFRWPQGGDAILSELDWRPEARKKVLSHITPRSRKPERKYSESDAKENDIVTLIIHGTFASSLDWWREMPGKSNFWSYINGHVDNLVGLPIEFSWSGGNNDNERRLGAVALINWRKAHPIGKLQIIAHSHGSSVVHLATAIDKHFEVENMISLGAPARIEYPPQLMNQIHRLYNVYSENDFTQIVGGLGGRRGEGRTQSDGLSSANHHIPYLQAHGGVVPIDHSDLHEELVWAHHKLLRLLL